MIADESFLRWAWRELHSTKRHLLLRFAASFLSALVLLAASLLAAWLWAHLTHPAWGWVYEAELGSAVVLGAALWFGVLVWLWRRARIALHVIATIGIAAAFLGLSFTFGAVLRVREPEYFIGAFLLLAIGGVILVWLPLAMGYMRRRPVTDADDIVRVNCPQCGYSLVGLRDLRCPECGARFTVDELIRAQNYGGASAAQAESVEVAPVDAEPAELAPRDTLPGTTLRGKCPISRSTAPQTD